MDENLLLAQYGRTMRSAQVLEERLKVLLLLHKMITTGSQSASPLSDMEFEALLSGGTEATMGQALSQILQELSTIHVSPLPSAAEDGLWRTIRARNFLAHKYFQARGLLIEDETARPGLIAELQWLSEVFNGWVPTLDKWIDALLKVLDISEEYIEEEDIVGEMANLQQEQLAKLKSDLAKIGIDVPPIPNESA
jgi:hypothetical protein